LGAGAGSTTAGAGEVFGLAVAADRVVLRSLVLSVVFLAVAPARGLRADVLELLLAEVVVDLLAFAVVGLVLLVVLVVLVALAGLRVVFDTPELLLALFLGALFCADDFLVVVFCRAVLWPESRDEDGFLAGLMGGEDIRTGCAEACSPPSPYR
jgi:hypothetical protein